MDIGLFAGRFHPLFVHLPIGFILLAFLLECYFLITKREIGHNLIAIMYLLGAVSAVFAVVSGLLLSGSNAYPPAMLQQHKWLGIFTAILAFILYAVKAKRIFTVRYSVLFSVVITLMVAVTGHLGGNLTHGSDYLVEYGPELLRRVVGVESEPKVLQRDSLVIYSQIILPVFQSKCIACHNPDDSYGGLDLTSYQSLFTKGETGTPVLPGNAEESEIFKRVTMSHSSVRFMPPYGDELDFGEIQVLKYWIDQGADSALVFEPEKLDISLISQLKRDYDIDLTPRPFYETDEISPIDSLVMKEIEKFGFVLEPLSEVSNWLNVRYTGDSVTADHLAALSKAADHIVFADLHGVQINDLIIEPIGSFSNLVRLDLHDNPLSDSAVAYFMNLNKLEVINLYQTSLTDSGFEKLMSLPSLNRIYTLETGVTSSFIDRARQQYPEREIISSFEFVVPDTVNIEGSR